MASRSLDFQALLNNPGLGLEHRTNYRCAIIANLHMRCLSGFFTSKHNLSAAGWRVLGIIGHYQPVFPVTVVQLTSMDAYNVTRTVGRLAKMGLVHRRADITDRRRVVLRLSNRGEVVCRDIEAATRAMELELRGALTPQEWRRFSNALDKLNERARKRFSGEEAWKSIIGDTHGEPPSTLTATDAAVTDTSLTRRKKPAAR